MFRLRRRSILGRAGIVAAVIGMLALTSLPGASAASSASQSTTATVSASASSTSSSSTASAEGDTKCVPWGKGNLGLKCTGTYSGNTAWDPWVQKDLKDVYPNQSAKYQPTVTISQAKDLTDQDVQITWSNFTPSFGSGFAEPNPTTDSGIYQVSLFECKGTNPDWSDGYQNDCYVDRAVGDNNVVGLTQGPANAMVENTLDTSVPPNIPSNSLGFSPYSPIWPMFGVPPSDGNGNPIPCGTFTPDACSFNGGDPATWTGQADFHIEAPTPRSQGGFFNCGPKTPCSLVIDPNWGGTPACSVLNSANCKDQYTDTSGCNTHTFGGNFDTAIGDFQGSGPTVPAYGESQSPGLQGGANPAAPTQNNGACWTADRIVIPLSFAPTSRNCPNKTPQFYAAGSPMMQVQMLQWEAGWCTGPTPVSMSYNFEVDESTARRDFLAGGQAGGARTDMALVTLPVDAAAQQQSSRKFTYAPLANSGTGIAYYIDDGTTGSQLNRMVLDPRLLAKLTTQSYALEYGCTSSPPGNPPQPSISCDPAVQKDPVSLFDDPEFQTLNRNCQPYGGSANYVCGGHTASNAYEVDSSDFPSDSGSGGANDDVTIGGFLPTMLQSESDMTYDMTGWVASNQDATGFLDGKTDPWGTHVNNDYLGVSYPVQVIDNQQDPGWTNPDPKCITQGTPPKPNCTNTVIPGATMQATWNFQPDLDTIAQDLLSSQPTSNSNQLQCPSTQANNGGCTSVQELTLTGLEPEFIGSRALLSEMDLGDIANYQFPAADLVNGGNNAVGPTQASVEAAVKDMKTNPDGITQYANYASTDPNAYPLAMVDYAMVPTCGLSSSEASAIADFLTKAATTGQVQGEAPGQLAPGYYPLTAKQKAQTLEAAQEVKAQDCKSAPPDNTVSGHHGVNDTSKATGNGHPGTGIPTNSASGKKSPSSAASPAGGAVTPKAQTAAFGQKSPDSSLTGVLLLLSIIAGALLLVGGPAAWAITATGKWPVVFRWLRPIQARLRAALVAVRRA